ncbi:MAG: SDR family NAD(P)-dependent oxidoreductase [Myxococcales bacterium]|nr:SDR family NAD(P)-dependent oxidoreductase [Myxococcales bacterium]
MNDEIKQLFDELSASERQTLAGLLSNPPEPLAIIGMGCYFPGGSVDVQKYWQLLSGGQDAVREVPPERWDVSAFFDAAPDAPGRMYTRYGAFLDGVDRFDSGFFEISPREAAQIDPQQRLLLEVAWQALEDAGLPPDSLRSSRTGVFVGACAHDYEQLQSRAARIESIDAHTLLGDLNSVLSGRLSYTLGLKGPSMTVDTACSSSLVALHLAAQALRQRQCDLALVGGVNLILSPDGYIKLSRMRALSPDGRCRAFDSRANGYVRGEGVGVLVLRRLSDALAAADRIQATVLGSAVNHDGRSAGLAAPSGSAQRDVVQAALQDADVAPPQVGYIEAHGTGTPLGDPIELEALRDVFARQAGGQPLWLGSVKTNIGHLEAAAGVAGVIKTVLALQHERLPAHLHFQQLNPRVALSDTGLAVADRPQPWPRSAVQRVAGVSSFGISGTNAHVVLGEAPLAPPAPTTVVPQSAQLLVISARTPDALREQAARISALLQSPSAPALQDVLFTLHTGRSFFPHRLAVVADGPPALARALQGFVADGASSGPQRQHGHARAGARCTLLCAAGAAQQRAQYQAVYDRWPCFRQAYEQTTQALTAALPSLLRLGPPIAALPMEAAVLSDFVLLVATATLWRSLLLDAPDVVSDGSAEDGATLAAAYLRGEKSLAQVAAVLAAMRAEAHAGPPPSGPPGPTGEALQIVVGSASPQHLPLRGHSTELQGDLLTLQALATCAVVGLGVRWRAFHDGQPGQRVALPTYPFERTALWAAPRPTAPSPASTASPSRAASSTAASSMALPSLSGAPQVSPDRDSDWLGRRFALPLPLWIAEQDLSASTFSALSGEAEGKADSLAASTLVYVVQALLGARATGRSDVALRDVEVGLPPALWGDDLRRWQVLVDAPGGALLVASRPAAVEQSGWIAHLRAQRVARSDVPATDLLAAVPDGAQPIDWTQCVRSLGLGPTSLAPVTRAWRHGDDWHVQLPGQFDPQSAKGAELFALLRFAWVAGLVALGCTEPQGGSAFRLQSIRSLQLGHAHGAAASSAGTGRLWLRARPVAGGECDLDLLGSSGAPLLSLRGVRSETVSSEEQQGQIPHADRRRLWAVEWQPMGDTTPVLEPSPRPGHIAVLDDAFGSGLRLRDALVSDGHQVTLVPWVTHRDATTGWADLTTLGRPEAALHVVDLRPLSLSGAALTASSLALQQQAARQSSMRLHVVTRGAVAARPDDRLDPSQAAIWGLLRCFDSEHPGRCCALYDLSAAVGPDGVEGPSQGAPVDLAKLATQISHAVAKVPRGLQEWAWRDGTLLRPHLQPAPWAQREALPSRLFRGELRDDRCYVVSGGLGGLGLAIVHSLLLQGARHVLVLSRRAESDLPDATRRSWGSLRSRFANADLRLLAVDVGCAQGLEAALSPCRMGQLPPIGGILHAAGVLHDAALAKLTAADFDRVLVPKLRGAQNLIECCGAELQFFVCLSSVAAWFGNPGQAAYAAANSALDAWAQAQRARGLPTVSLALGPVAGIGMAAELRAEECERRGIEALPVPSLLSTLAACIATIDCVPASLALVGLRVPDLAHVATHAPLPALLSSRLPMEELRPADLGAARAAPPTPTDSSAPAPDALLLGPWAQLAQCFPSERHSQVLAQVDAAVRSVLGLPAGYALKPEQRLDELGMDSMLGLDLVKVLSHALGTELPNSLALDCPHVAAMTAHIVGLIDQ